MSDNVLQAFELCCSGKFNLSHSSLTSPSLWSVLDNLPQQDPPLAEAISTPRKHPTDRAPSSTTVIHEKEFSEVVEDDVEVMLEDMWNHLDGTTLPDGLAEVDGGLQLGLTAAEEHDMETLGEVTVVCNPESDSNELGQGKQVKRARNLEKEMERLGF